MIRAIRISLTSSRPRTRSALLVPARNRRRGSGSGTRSWDRGSRRPGGSWGRSAPASTGCGTRAGRIARPKAATGPRCTAETAAGPCGRPPPAAACRGWPPRSMASSTRYGIRSSSSVWPAAGGRSSAVGCIWLTAASAGMGCRPDGPLVSSQRSQSKQKRLVDAGDRAQAAAGVAVHRGIAHGRLAAVAGREEQGVLHVGQQPHARPADPGLDVLQGNVVGLPGERSAKYLLDAAKRSPRPAGRSPGKTFRPPGPWPASWRTGVWRRCCCRSPGRRSAAGGAPGPRASWPRPGRRCAAVRCRKASSPNSPWANSTIRATRQETADESAPPLRLTTNPCERLFRR